MLSTLPLPDHISSIWTVGLFLLYRTQLYFFTFPWRDFATSLQPNRSWTFLPSRIIGKKLISTAKRASAARVHSTVIGKDISPNIRTTVMLRRIAANGLSRRSRKIGRAYCKISMSWISWMTKEQAQLGYAIRWSRLSCRVTSVAAALHRTRVTSRKWGRLSTCNERQIYKE